MMREHSRSITERCRGSRCRLVMTGRRNYQAALKSMVGSPLISSLFESIHCIALHSTAPLNISLYMDIRRYINYIIIIIIITYAGCPREIGTDHLTIQGLGVWDIFLKKKDLHLPE